MQRDSVTAMSMFTAVKQRGRQVAARAGRRVHRALWGPSIERVTVAEYFARHAPPGPPALCETVHPEEVACNPLPRNIASRDELPATRGWWGYSFRDVPARTSGETFIATIPDCQVVWYRDAARGDDFYPAVLAANGRLALDLRELRFRPPHADVLDRAGGRLRLSSATWILERVYHNHSHWLTAHLPKILLLAQRGGLGDVLVPAERTAAIDASLELLGLRLDRFRTFEFSRPLQVDALTILGTDRFRPELLRLVPAACGVLDAPPPRRRVFISRAGAARRRLVNEDEIWTLLEPHGFERVRMEELSFGAQVALMRETAVLLAPHGAGLTNMMFCPPGADVVELADPGFPNPNFYALASAMRHRYWLVRADSLGEGHPIDKDLRVERAAIAGLLPRLLDERTSSS